MKKILLLFILIFFPIVLSAQDISNSSFESWTEFEPDDWRTNNFIISPSPESNITPVTQSGEAHSGESAVKLELLSFMVGEEERVYAAQLFTSRFIFTGKPASFNGYFQFHPQTENDSLTILVILFDENAIAASALLHIKQTMQSYTNISVPFFYFQPESAPDSAEIHISILANENSSLNSVGTFALADDLSFEGIATSTEESIINITDDFEINQNYPNPFNPLTKIDYSIPYDAFVELKVYDILGNEVMTIVNENQKKGNYIVDFNGEGLSSGIYIARITADNFNKSFKMTLLK